MIPENILRKMRNLKAVFAHPSTAEMEAAAARRVYDNLVAKYGQPDQDEPFEFVNIPIWRPAPTWKVDIIAKQAEAAREAYEWLYNRADIAIMPAAELDPEKRGYLVARLEIANGNQGTLHLNDAELLSFAIDLGFVYSSVEPGEAQAFARRAAAAREWFDSVRAKS